MSTDRSWYRVLGVNPGASAEEVRTSYRALVRRLHPDRLGDVPVAERALADRRMREINEAWGVLGDPVARSAYDADLRRRAGAAGADRFARAAGDRRTPAGDPESGQQRLDDEDIPRWYAEEIDDDEDLVEMSPHEVFILRRAPWIAAIVVALAILIGTAYAGGRLPDPPAVGDLRDQQNCVDTPAEPCGTSR